MVCCLVLSAGEEGEERIAWVDRDGRDKDGDEEEDAEEDVEATPRAIAVAEWCVADALRSC